MPEAHTRRKKSYRVISVLFLMGAAVLAYPAVSNLRVQDLIRQDRAAMADLARTIDDAEKEVLREAIQAYNDAVVECGQQGVDPAAYLDMEQTDGVLGILRIPAIRLQLSIRAGTTEEILARSAGHVPGSSLPFGGEGTHAVLTGHTGLPSARLFTDLRELVTGDRFYIDTALGTLTYVVDQIKIVLPDIAQDLLVVPGMDYVTLVTCTPYGLNTHRLLVRGERVDNDPG